MNSLHSQLLSMNYWIMFITFWLFIITSAAIIHSESKSLLENSRNVKTTMRNILGSCYSNYSASNPVFFMGNINELIDEYLFDVPPVSVISMNSLLGFEVDHKDNSSFIFKPNVIVLEGDSPETLQSNLSLLKSTEWWNYRAYYFILGVNQDRCENIGEILTTAWKMNIIRAIYICLNTENIPELFTLNAITNYAVAPWEKIEIAVKGNVYRQLFDANISCQNLHYDKTKVLNGFKITGTIAKISPRNKVKDLNVANQVARNFMKVLNISIIVKRKPPGDLIVQTLLDGTADMILNFGFIYWNPERQFLFPYLWTEVMAAKKSDGYLSTLEKIDNLWSVPIRILGLLIISIFFLVMVYENDDISSATLEVVRLLTYVSVHTTRKNLSFRIFFAMMMIFMVISNGVFQGAISSFLTKPQQAKGVTTVDQLRDLNYSLYTLPGTAERAKEECPDNEVIEVPLEVCPDMLLNKSHGVCVTFREFFYEFYPNSTLTLMKEPLKATYFNHKCRDDWPLHERVNNYFIQIFEAGLIGYWLTEKIRLTMDKYRAKELGLLSPNYTPVQLDALDFAFELLAIGLCLASVIFILEVVVNECKICS
ncbi:uncharacterized protein LOC135160124 [Diachasmimorpha longicaudata]|uniref:uncharacterized protein LOC135160124 n=1 Tax=Diachasmimorpha longicaudata TaxID=58733 RepID=UPI0030B90704